MRRRQKLDRDREETIMIIREKMHIEHDEAKKYVNSHTSERSPQ